MNSSKSLVLWFGSWCYKPEQCAGIKWNDVPPIFLGVPLDENKLSAHYRKERVLALQSYAQTFVPYRLFIFGKAEDCNTFWQLKFTMYYKLHIVPGLYTQRFHRIFAASICSSAFEPMRRDNVLRQVSEVWARLSASLSAANSISFVLFSRYFASYKSIIPASYTC